MYVHVGQTPQKSCRPLSCLSMLHFNMLPCL